MRTLLSLLFVAIGPIVAGRALAGEPADNAPQSIVWMVDRLDSIAGHKATVVGSPRVIDAPHGKAIQFDGQSDGLFLDTNPLASLSVFTAEVVFQPAEGGAKEQRFV